MTTEPAEPVPARRSTWREALFLVSLAIVLALLIKGLLIQAFSIPSESMQNTLQPGDRVLVNKLIYDVRDIHRGEVVVFDGIDNWAAEVEVQQPSSVPGKVARKIGLFLGVASDEKDYIKRVIGLPGDRVMCCSPSGKVVVQPPGGEPIELAETYLLNASDDVDANKWFCAAGNDRTSCPPGAEGLVVPDGRLWVMGDHRGFSADSRAHYTDAHQGTVPIKRVVGRAFVVVWPVSRFDLLGVPPTFTQALAPAAPFVLGGMGALPIVLLRRKLRAA